MKLSVYTSIIKTNTYYSIKEFSLKYRDVIGGVMVYFRVSSVVNCGFEHRPFQTNDYRIE